MQYWEQVLTSAICLQKLRGRKWNEEILSRPYKWPPEDGIVVVGIHPSYNSCLVGNLPYKASIACEALGYFHNTLANVANVYVLSNGLTKC